jgi:hypothetical protein
MMTKEGAVACQGGTKSASARADVEVRTGEAKAEATMEGVAAETDAWGGGGSQPPLEAHAVLQR